MGRVNDDNWLDEALNEAIHSDDTQPDFEKWKAEHPEAVEMLTTRTPRTQRPLRIRRIMMNATFVKLAAAAVIVIAGIFGVSQVMQPKEESPKIIMSNGESLKLPGLYGGTVVEGPRTHTFADGSTVQLAPGASIRTFADAGKRGFEHLAGQIDVTVAKAKGEFIVTSLYGEVKALGTQFTMNLVDDTDAQTKEPVRLLAVEVVEGTVEVRNAKGIQTLHEKQNTVVSQDSAPYGYGQDEALPEGLRTRIAAMVAAFGTGDRAAWAENFNLGYIYKLGKGEVKYDPNLFGGSAEDAENLKKMLAQVNSLDQMKQMFLESINITEPVEVYVRAVELSADGAHARAECVRHKGNRHTVITRPQWHYFDGGWWQVDD